MLHIILWHLGSSTKISRPESHGVSKSNLASIHILRFCFFKRCNHGLGQVINKPKDLSEWQGLESFKLVSAALMTLITVGVAIDRLFISP